MFISRFSKSFILPLIMLLVTACSGPQQADVPAQTIAPLQSEGTPVPLIAPTATPMEPAAVDTEMADEDELLHLWAESGVLSPFEMPGVAVGAPESTPVCGNELLAGYETPDSEIYLTLQYEQPLIPAAVNLVLKAMTDSISRVEILNTKTGLGREIFTENSDRSSGDFPVNDCTIRIQLPVDVDFEINSILIGFNDLAAASLLDAVELVGSPVIYAEPLVYWRVPLKGRAASLAVDPLNQVWVSTEPNNVLKFDVEGNLLEEFTAPSNGRISDLAIEAAGDLVLSDGEFGEYIILSPEGEKARGGGDAPTVEVAIGPGQKNVYMLGELAGLYYLLSYLPGTGEIINPLPLDGTAYTALAFNSENQLFTLRDKDGFLVEIDALTGLEINSIPLKGYDEGGLLPEDLAIDREGNYYVLFTSNDDNAAVKIYDPDGFFSRSFGTLIDQPVNDWQEGSYYKPEAIALTPDARFAFIIDGYGETNYLTCLMLRTD